MEPRQPSRLVKLNRGLIFVLSMTGLLMDGYQNADVPFSIALIVWLWLPVCTRVEVVTLNRVRPSRWRGNS